MVSISEINECNSLPCRGDQVCVKSVNYYECRCRPGEFEQENSDICERKYELFVLLHNI